MLNFYMGQIAKVKRVLDLRQGSCLGTGAGSNPTAPPSQCISSAPFKTRLQ